MELHDDDKPVGRILTRREMLALVGGAGAVLVVGTGFRNFDFSQTGTATAEATAEAAGSCVVKPEMTEGPYFVDEMLNRSDIRIEPSDGSIKEGLPLRLKFRVSQIDADGCTPLEGAQIDIWNCDAVGVYSGVKEAGFDTVGEKWLRGYQITDENGEVEFVTIYPGWYSGRAVHVHFKIRTDPASEAGYEFTSQLFFDDDLSDKVFAEAPYAEGERDTRNDTDMHYAGGGEQLLLTLVEAADEEGFSAVFDIALDLSDEEAGADDSFSTGGGGVPGGNPPNGTPPAGGMPGRPGATATSTPGG